MVLFLENVIHSILHSHLVREHWREREREHLRSSHSSTAQKLTVFGEVVDDCVCLTVAVQVSQLRAAVHGHVVDAETSLAAAAGVQHGTLRGNRFY